MKIIQLIISILICQVAGGIGALFTLSAIPTWYSALNKPSFSPPNWLFGPVWTLLYTLMGISAYLIYQKGIEKKEVRIALIIFAVHLILNALWSILFFGLKNPGLAFVEIIILWLAIIFIMFKFYPLDKTASLLLIPYLLWVSFASILNFSIWYLNR